MRCFFFPYLSSVLFVDPPFYEPNESPKIYPQHRSTFYRKIPTVHRWQLIGWKYLQLSGENKAPWVSLSSHLCLTKLPFSHPSVRSCVAPFWHNSSSFTSHSFLYSVATLLKSMNQPEAAVHCPNATLQNSKWIAEISCILLMICIHLWETTFASLWDLTWLGEMNLKNLANHRQISTDMNCDQVAPVTYLAA